jgi:hypothetical protein
MATATKAKPRKKAATKKEVKDTLLSVLLDRSGSMSSYTHATIEGFNKFVAEQRGEEGIGALRMSLVQFDDQYEVNFTAEDVDDIPELDASSYIPRGMTALNDALLHSIRDTERWVKKNKYDGNVLFLIITDGLENASREASLTDVADAIQSKEDAGWSFVFMGANIDSFATGESYNIPVGNVANYNQSDLDGTWTATSASLTTSRTSGGYMAASGNYFNNDAANNSSLITTFNTPAAQSVNVVKDPDGGSLKPKKK